MPPGDTTPGRVLLLSLVLWGLGHFALGARRTAVVLLLAEIVGIALLAITAPALADGTAYLIPFLAGVIFIAAWAAQAIAAYRAARRRAGATAPQRGSPTLAIVLLGIPLLGWVCGYWLAAGRAASPGAVLDRFLEEWPGIAETPAVAAGIAADPVGLSRDAAAAIERLRDLCVSGVVDGDCAGPLRELTRDLRFTLSDEDDGRVRAALELVHYERRPIRLLGLVEGTELVAVPDRAVLRLDLRTVAGGRPLGVDIGARRWLIEDSRALR